MNRCGWLLVCLLPLCAAPGLARTWTDTQGGKVEGEFVRVLRGKVVLSDHGKIVQVPFGRLIEADQELVRQQLEARGQGSFVPPRKKPLSRGTADSKAADGARRRVVPAGK